MTMTKTKCYNLMTQLCSVLGLLGDTGEMLEDLQELNTLIYTEAFQEKLLDPFGMKRDFLMKKVENTEQDAFFRGSYYDEDEEGELWLYGYDEALILQLALERKGNLGNPEIPEKLRDHSVLNEVVQQRIHGWPTVLKAGQQLRSSLDPEKARKWSVGEKVMPGVLQSSIVPAKKEVLYTGVQSISRKRAREIEQEPEFHVEYRRGCTYLKISWKTPTTPWRARSWEGLPSDFGSAVVISDRSDAHNFHDMAGLLGANKHVEAESLRQLPHGIILHYHGKVGEGEIFGSDLERVVVLHHHLGQDEHEGEIHTEIESLISGRKMQIDDTVARLLTL